MAIPLDQVAQNEQGQREAGGDVPSQDVELAFRMGVKLMSEGNGLNIIKQAIQESKDPAMVIGQFLAQIMMALVQQLNQEASIDPRVFLASGGWLELMLDYIEKKLGYPEDFSDEVYGQVLEVLKASAQSGQAPQQGGQPAAPGPAPAPAGGM